MGNMIPFENSITPYQAHALLIHIQNRWSYTATARRLGIGRSAAKKLVDRAIINFTDRSDEPTPGSIESIHRRYVRRRLIRQRGGYGRRISGLKF